MGLLGHGLQCPTVRRHWICSGLCSKKIIEIRRTKVSLFDKQSTKSFYSLLQYVIYRKFIDKESLLVFAIALAVSRY